MIFRMVKKDFLRNKITILTLFLFILLSSLFASLGGSMAAELSGALDHLLARAKIPHFVQMHTGEINKQAVSKFISENSYVAESQNAEMISMGSKNILFNGKKEENQNDIMDISLIKQNKDFDFLLDMKNNPVKVKKGEIAVPVYYMQKEKLKKGDKVTVNDGSFSKELKISDFIRDAQMNPAIIHSKRFVINSEDFDLIKGNAGKTEYLVEFRLNDVKNLKDFSDEYNRAGFLLNGPVIDYNLFILLNSLTDGIVIAAIILVSIIVNIVAALCLSFTVLASIEEDYTEIGTMKAIGLENKNIKRIYTAKYGITAALGSTAGYIVSHIIKKFLLSGIVLYMGSSEQSITGYVLSAFMSLIVFLAIMLFCLLTLGKFRKISAVEALGTGIRDKRKTSGIKLRYTRFLSPNIFLGVQDVLVRLKLYRLLFLIFFICSFLIIVPVNFLNTIKAPEFIVYMGTAGSDIRIDIQQNDKIDEDFRKITSYINNDNEVSEVSPIAVNKGKVLNDKGVFEDIDIETGNFKIFPAEYIHGKEPENDGEIALSYLNGKDMNKKTGDKLILKTDGKRREMTVTGIYQDITNGGKGAKAVVKEALAEKQRYIININVTRGTDVNKKITEYKKVLPDAKITYPEEYMNQTMGDTVKQLGIFTTGVTAAACCMAVLITSLFLKMLLSKDRYEISILRKIGFSVKNIKVQYVTRMLSVLTPGIIIGSMAANTAGQKIVSFLWSFLGAAEINFIINPFQSFVLYPVILTTAVITAALGAANSLDKHELKK